jgi:hypothetical protein
MTKTKYGTTPDGVASGPIGRAHLNAAVRALEYAWSELEGDPVGQARLQIAIRDFITTVLEAALRDKDQDSEGQA